MPNSPAVHFKYSGDDERTRVWFEDGDSEELLVTALGNDCYRLEESSLLGEARYRDVIRAIRRADGGLLFHGIETRSDLVTQSWLLSEDILDSTECGSLLCEVMAMGGNWERAFGGLLLVHIPESSAAEIAERVKKLTVRGRVSAQRPGETPILISGRKVGFSSI
jgi:hypothetical protein